MRQWPEKIRCGECIDKKKKRILSSSADHAALSLWAIAPTLVPLLRAFADALETKKTPPTAHRIPRRHLPPTRHPRGYTLTEAAPPSKLRGGVEERSKGLRSSREEGWSVWQIIFYVVVSAKVAAGKRSLGDAAA